MIVVRGTLLPTCLAFPSRGIFTWRDIHLSPSGPCCLTHTLQHQTGESGRRTWTWWPLIPPPASFISAPCAIVPTSAGSVPVKGTHSPLVSQGLGGGVGSALLLYKWATFPQSLCSPLVSQSVLAWLGVSYLGVP